MRDGIKRVQLQRCGKLKSTHPSKLQLPHLVYCSCTAAAAVHEILFYPSCTAAHVLPQLYISLSLVYCGTSCTAVAPQFKPVYTVPENEAILARVNFSHLHNCRKGVNVKWFCKLYSSYWIFTILKNYFNSYTANI